jgi:hypothetical protein
MLTFIVQHIDALITTAGGIFACIYGFRPARGTTPTQQRAVKILRVCGPLVVLFGVLRFFMDEGGAPAWRRHPTGDGMASAEFPATPRAKQQTDTINGVSAQRTSLHHDVPFKDISLLLSFSPMPPNEPDVPGAERIAALKAYFAQQGFSLLREMPVQLGASPGFALDLQQDGGKVRMWTRIAYVAGKVYRVVVSSTGSHHDDAIISHFLESFRIERTGASPSS